MPHSRGVRRLPPGTLWVLFTVVAVVSGLGAVSIVRSAVAGSSPDAMSASQVAAALASTSRLPVPDVTPSSRETPTARPTASARPTRSSGSSLRPSGTTTSPSRPTGAPPSSTPSHQATPKPTKSPTKQPTGTVTRAFTSRAGTVVASCTDASTYLRSWSPAEGFKVGEVHRGPGREAEITFLSTGGSEAEVKMKVTCQSGRPVVSVEADAAGD
jgi:hypothetical protein